MSKTWGPASALFAKPAAGDIGCTALAKTKQWGIEMILFSELFMLIAGVTFAYFGFDGGNDIHIGFGMLMVGNAFVIFATNEIKETLFRMQGGTVPEKGTTL